MYTFLEKLETLRVWSGSSLADRDIWILPNRLGTVFSAVSYKLPTKDFCNLLLAGAQQIQREKSRHLQGSADQVWNCCSSEPAERPSCSSRHTQRSEGLRALFPEGSKFLHAQTSFYSMLYVQRQCLIPGFTPLETLDETGLSTVTWKRQIFNKYFWSVFR